MIKKIGVMGAGAMGGGIAQVAAQSGYEVVLHDLEMKYVEKAMASMEKFLSKSVAKGKIEADKKDEIMGRISGTTDMEAFSDVDLVIEAIIEDLEIKKEAFVKLDKICADNVILATNTSSMSITVIGSSTQRPDKVVGMHFFNPPPIMKLVEVIRGYHTSDETINAVKEVCTKLGKTAVEVRKDEPGFIVNRLMIAQWMEAMKLLQEGVASKEDIDTAVKLGLNHPMGVFELQDFGGVDIGYHVMNYLYDELKDPRWNPPQALKDLMRAGRLGRKTGAGWFDYED